MLKSLFGAVIIGADVICGMAAPEAFRALHHQPHSHLYGAYAFYVVLGLLTLWVIASVAQAVSGGGQKPVPPQRPAGYQYGGQR